MDNMLLTIVEAFATDGFYVYGNIPSRKLDNAIQNYPVDTQDTVIGLIDSTLMGSAKTGMAIGLKGIYWKNDWKTKSAKSFLSWDELAENNAQISCSMFDVHLGSGAVFAMSGSSMSKNQAVNLLSSVINYYKDLKRRHQSSEDCYSQNGQSTQTEVLGLPDHSDKDGYIGALVIALALITCADGDVSEEMVDESCIFLESESGDGKEECIVEFSETVRALCDEKERSNAFFKLKVASCLAKLKGISSQELRERILIMVEGLLESGANNSPERLAMAEKIRTALL